MEKDNPFGSDEHFSLKKWGREDMKIKRAIAVLALLVVTLGVALTYKPVYRIFRKSEIKACFVIGEGAPPERLKYIADFIGIKYDIYRASDIHSTDVLLREKKLMYPLIVYYGIRDDPDLTNSAPVLRDAVSKYGAKLIWIGNNFGSIAYTQKLGSVSSSTVKIVPEADLFRGIPSTEFTIEDEMFPANAKFLYGLEKMDILGTYDTGEPALAHSICGKGEMLLFSWDVLSHWNYQLNHYVLLLKAMQTYYPYPRVYPWKSANKAVGVIRLEDISANDSVDIVNGIFDEYRRKGVPLNISFIPVYRGHLKEVSVSSSSEWKEFLSRHADNVLVHGYSHQWDGISGIDCEFWDEISNKPLYESLGKDERWQYNYALQRASSAKTLLSDIGVPCNRWATPHYMGSRYDFKAIYDAGFTVLVDPIYWTFGPYPFYNQYVDKECSYFHEGKPIPFLVVPENSGYDDPDIVKRLSSDLASINGLTQFFFHVDKATYFNDVVDHLQGEGVVFCTVKDVAEWYAKREKALDSAEVNEKGGRVKLSIEAVEGTTILFPGGEKNYRSISVQGGSYEIKSEENETYLILLENSKYHISSSMANPVILDTE